MNHYLIYTVNKEGHYKDYEKVLEKITNGKVIRSIFRQIILSFKNCSIIYLDGDSFHLLFTPLILIRSWIGLRNYLFSIRTERVLQVKIQKIIKLPIYMLIKYTTNTKIISIHKESIRKEYDKFITDFIYCLQYWDLRLINVRRIKPKELNKNITNIISIIGEFNDKKSRKELLKYLKNNSCTRYKFLFTGKILEEDSEFLKDHPDCIVIDRNISNEELFYVYETSTFIWCFYSPEVNRPSGIFGRAMQLEKQIIVKKNGYLHKNNTHYPYLKIISCVEEVNELEINYSKTDWVNVKDSYKDLLNIIDYRHNN